MIEQEFAFEVGPGGEGVEARPCRPQAGGGEFGPRNPFRCGDFVWIRNRLLFAVSHENGTNLVFDDAIQLSSILEIGQGVDQIDSLDSEFLFEAAIRRVQMRFAGSRVSAAGVGPDAGPGFFGKGSLLSEHVSFSVEEENRKRAMERRI